MDTVRSPLSSQITVWSTKIIIQFADNVVEESVGVVAKYALHLQPPPARPRFIRMKVIHQVKSSKVDASVKTVQTWLKVYRKFPASGLKADRQDRGDSKKDPEFQTLYTVYLHIRCDKCSSISRLNRQSARLQLGEARLLRGMRDELTDLIELGVVLVLHQLEQHTLAGRHMAADLPQTLQGTAAVVQGPGHGAVRRNMDFVAVVLHIDSRLLQTNVALQPEEHDRLKGRARENILDLLPHLRRGHAEQGLGVLEGGMGDLQFGHNSAQLLRIVFRHDQGDVHVLAGEDLEE